MSTRSKFVQVVALAGFVVLVTAAAALGSLATVPELRPWYDSLRKPAWTPPNWVFGPAWSTLYMLMAVSAWRVWRRADASDRARGAALAFWGLQLALNVAWSWLFFGLHRPTLAFVELVALWLAILFAGVLAFNRSYQLELDGGALESLLLYPGARWGIYVGKLIANLVFVPDKHASADFVFTERFNNSGFGDGTTTGATWWLYVLPLGFLLTQYTITGLTRVRTCPKRRTVRPTPLPRASGSRSSTRPSSAGSCCWPSPSPQPT